MCYSLRRQHQNPTLRQTKVSQWSRIKLRNKSKIHLSRCCEMKMTLLPKWICNLRSRNFKSQMILQFASVKFL